MLDLRPDELLTTCRAVRKRLDLTRPVPDDVIRACAAAALQAPSGSNVVSMGFVVVRDEEQRRAIGDVYARCWEIYQQTPFYAGAIEKGTDAERRQQARVVDSATYLAEHLGEVPAIVIACSEGLRIDGQAAMLSASILGNVLPATWSFMLAARARGLGTAWTTMHLFMEREVADICGIPFDTVQQACLTPLAYTLGTDFRPAARPDPDAILHWDRW